MASRLSSPAAAVAIILLFLSLSCTSLLSTDINLPLQSRRSLNSISNEEDLDPQISKPKSPVKKKLILESQESKNTTKSLKPKKIDSTLPSSPAIISAPAAKSKLNKSLSAGIKSKFNKTLSAGTKFTVNKTLTAVPFLLKTNLNKTGGVVSKKNATKLLLKPVKPLKSNSTKSPVPKTNSTKLQILKSPNSAPKTERKKLEAKDPPTAKPQFTPKPKSKAPQMETAIVESNAAGDNNNLISEFRDLPSRLHSVLLPDIYKLSTTSKLYLSKTHREISAGMKPLVGKKYAPLIASTALLVLPLLIVTALFRHLLRAGNSASVQRAVVLVQAYLAIYFATLSLTALATGLEPLLFFYVTSPGAYAWTQAVQTFGYVVYLIAQLIALIVAFSVGEGEGAAGKAVGLAQMLLGLAVGMHYYITVLHRAVAGDEPRANWKVHGIYATCFVVICGLGRADRRKKADGKKS